MTRRVTREFDPWFPALSRLMASCFGCCRRTRVGESATPAFAPAVAGLDEVLNGPGPPAPSLIEPSGFSSGRLSSSRRSRSTNWSTDRSTESGSRGGAASLSSADADAPEKKSMAGACISHTPDLDEAPPHLNVSSRMESPRVPLETNHRPPAPPRASQWEGGGVVTPPPSPPEPPATTLSPPSLPRPTKERSRELLFKSHLAGEAAEAQSQQGPADAQARVILLDGSCVQNTPSIRRMSSSLHASYALEAPRLSSSPHHPHPTPTLTPPPPSPPPHPHLHSHPHAIPS